jgi:hypothetical protein
MTKANIAATINQPERPKKYVNIRCEELQIYPKEEEYNGSTRIKSPATRIIKDTMTKNKGILLKLVKVKKNTVNSEVIKNKVLTN